MSTINAHAYTTRRPVLRWARQKPSSAPQRLGKPQASLSYCQHTGLLATTCPLPAPGHGPSKAAEGYQQIVRAVELKIETVDT